jgi:hypothetical protein
MRTPKNWSRVSLGHPKFGTGCPLEIWLGCQIYGLIVAPLYVYIYGDCSFSLSLLQCFFFKQDGQPVVLNNLEQSR